MPLTRDLEERDGYDSRRNAGGTWGTFQGGGVRGPGGTEGLRQQRGLSWQRYHEGELRCQLAFWWPGVEPTVREGRQVLLWPRVLRLPLSLLPPPSSLRSTQQTLSPLFSGLSGPAAPEKERGCGHQQSALPAPAPAGAPSSEWGLWPQERAGTWWSCPLPHTFFNVTRTLGASLGQGELHGCRRSLGAGRVCVLPQGVHTQQLACHPSPQGRKCRLPTALVLAEDPRHGKS